MGVKAGPAGASAADSRRRPGAPVPEDLLHQAHAVMQSSACRIAYPRLAGLRAATTHSIRSILLPPGGRSVISGLSSSGAAELAQRPWPTSRHLVPSSAAGLTNLRTPGEIRLVSH